MGTAFLSAHHIIHERTDVTGFSLSYVDDTLDYFMILIFDDILYFLGMFRGINKVIEEHVEALSRQELEKVIWANARLNNRTGEIMTDNLPYAVLHWIKPFQ